MVAGKPAKASPVGAVTSVVSEAVADVSAGALSVDAELPHPTRVETAMAAINIIDSTFLFMNKSSFLSSEALCF